MIEYIIGGVITCVGLALSVKFSKVKKIPLSIREYRVRRDWEKVLEERPPPAPTWCDTMRNWEVVLEEAEESGETP